jgi:hypothetical protein
MKLSPVLCVAESGLLTSRPTVSDPRQVNNYAAGATVAGAFAFLNASANARHRFPAPVGALIASVMPTACSQTGAYVPATNL